MTSGGTAEPVALTHSIKVVQALDPGCLLRRFRASVEPSTRPLDPCPSRMPVSSILYRLAGWIALICGIERFRNQALITSVDAPLIRCESIGLAL